MSRFSRRKFLESSLAVAPVSISAAHSFSPSIRKGVRVDMLPKHLSYLDRFQMARDAGFEALQVFSTPDQVQAEEIKTAALKARLRIDSVANITNWKYPLSSSDAAVVEKGLEGMRTSLHNAKLWGAHAVLLVPAVVNAQTSYRQAWVRSQNEIRTLIPLAEELKVTIAVEEVWNKFLLSPLEFATYVDQFNSPWLKAWFDVGNVAIYGYPQDWIRTLGLRIADFHVKGFKRKGNCFEWVNIGEGDIDWPAVREALAEIGYRGTAITELKSGDEAYLKDISRRVSKYVLGAA